MHARHTIAAAYRHSIGRAGSIAALLAALMLGGCASCGLDPGSPLKARSSLRVAGSAETLSAAERDRRWCAQRHVDYQNGKAPGGARTLDQKRVDDGRCRAIQH